MDGFRKGPPQALNNTSWDFLQTQDGYAILFIMITLKKYLDSPLTSKTNENGVRDFINDMENEIIYVGKAGLEDLVTFHEAEFEITDGYYLNNGRHNKINNVIKNLYDLKRKLQNDNNPADMVTKLLMKSMYGKTVIEPIETYTIIRNNKDDFGIHTSLNYDYIGSAL